MTSRDLRALDMQASVIACLLPRSGRRLVLGLTTCSALLACGGQEPAPDRPTVVAAAPTRETLSSAPAAPEPVPDAGPEAPARSATLELAAAPLIALRESPLKAAAPKPIGRHPNKTRRLKETARVSDTAPLARAQARPAAYDPLRLNEVHDSPATLPPGARADIPTSHRGQPLRVILESGAKLLLVYGPRYLAVVDQKKVEQVLDFDPPELALSAEDREFSDVHEAVYRDGIVYVCRGYNASLRSRKGYVTAVDVATGQMRWRSKALTCGGVVALIDDYVITGYGEDVMPYQLVLLSRADGSVVQSIRNDGAALDFLVDGSRVVVETYKHRITYELR